MQTTCFAKPVLVLGVPDRSTDYDAFLSLMNMYYRIASAGASLADRKEQVLIYYTISRKNCAKLFLSELRQISTNFDNFGRKTAKRLRLCEVYSFSTSPNSRHHTTVLNANVPTCYITL